MTSTEAKIGTLGVATKGATTFKLPSFLKNEDWWAVIIGFAAMVAGVSGLITEVHTISSWKTISTAFTPAFFLKCAIVGLGLLLVTLPAIWSKGESVRKYLIAYPLLFVLTYVAVWISKNEILGKQWGLEYAIWALALGLLISNTVGTPAWVRPALKTELFIKTGLVLLGASILFQQILTVGPLAILQSIFVISAVFFFSYFLATKAGLSKSLSTVMSAAVSICGVSAAIAVGGAAKANPKEVSYTSSLVLVMAVPLLVLMPIVSRLLGFSEALAGAWIGGVIDTTPAVAAAGSVYGATALKTAVVVKMAQNLFIGVAALLIALYFALKVEKRADTEKPKLIEIWNRFPKFILGFVLASILFSFIVTPAIGADATNAIIKGVTEPARGWFFALAFVAIGLETRLVDIVFLGRGKPFLVFTAAQIFNIFWTLALAYLIFGGVLWKAPF